MKSLEEQRVIESVKGSTQIQQHKNSIVSSISRYQQIVKYAKEGRLGAVTTSVRRLKLVFFITGLTTAFLKHLAQCQMRDSE